MTQKGRIDGRSVNAVASAAPEQGAEPVELAAALRVEPAHAPDRTSVARRRTRRATKNIDAASSALLDGYDDYRFGRNVGALTIKKERAALAAMIVAAGGATRLTPASLRRFAEASGFKTSSHNLYHKNAARFSAWLVKAGHVEADPFEDAPPPPAGRPNPNPCTRAERDLLLATVAEPVRSWLLLAAYAGLRAMEIAAVEREHLVASDDGYRLLVPRGKGRKPADVPAHPLVVELLQAAAPGRLWQVSAEQVSGQTNYAMSVAGIEGGPHRLRATFATEVYRAHRDLLVAQKACRHASVQSTMHYVRADESEVRGAIDGL